MVYIGLLCYLLDVSSKFEDAKELCLMYFEHFGIRVDWGYV